MRIIERQYRNNYGGDNNQYGNAHKHPESIFLKTKGAQRKEKVSQSKNLTMPKQF